MKYYIVYQMCKDGSWGFGYVVFSSESESITYEVIENWENQIKTHYNIEKVIIINWKRID